MGEGASAVNGTLETCSAGVRAPFNARRFEGDSLRARATRCLRLSCARRGSLFFHKPAVGTFFFFFSFIRREYGCIVLRISTARLSGIKKWRLFNCC